MPQQRNADPNANSRLELLPLADLSPDDAAKLLERFIRQESPEERIETHKLRLVADTLGGNPLTLKLAAHLISVKDFDALDDPQALQQLKSEAAQARLYSRVLAHIDDKDVQRLAIPGLVVRIIGKDLIREVLAGPCGLGDIDNALAAELFDKLAREITLVERLPDGVLRHRADIRRVMLSGMPDELRDQVEEIHRRAVKFWRSRTGAQARAEELYHMLRLGADRDELDGRWAEEKTAELQAGLQGALEELPPGSPARVWLAERLGVTLSEGERATIAVEAQESQAARAATQFLAHGDAGQALAVLEKQKPFKPGSRLFALLARVLFRLGRSDDALSLTKEGIASMRGADNESELTDLLLLQAYILERQERDFDALEALTRADIEGMTRVARLRMKVRRARILRKLNHDDPELRTEIIHLAADLENDLGRHPALLREVAAEVGDANAKVLGQALELFGPEILERMTSEELLDMLVNIGAYSREALSSFAGISRHSLIKQVRDNLDQLIHGSDERSRKATELFVEILRRSVNDTLRQSYEPLPAATPSETHPTTISAVDPWAGPASSEVIVLTDDSRQGLIDALADVPVDVLRKVSQFNLDVDLERLGGNLTIPELMEKLLDTAQSHGLLPQLLQGVLANASPDAAAKVRNIFAPRISHQFQPNDMEGKSMVQNSATPNVSGMMNHYKRLAAARIDSGAGFESVAAQESVAERTESTKDALMRIVKDYLNNDRRAIEIANKIVAEGGEALRMLDANDENALRRKPELFNGLEAIVRTDGSRPSFLIRNGDVDRNSSPIGSWADLLDRSAERLRTAITCVGRIDVPGTSSGFMGTGFLIQENLILTNRHVLQVSARLYNGVWRFAEGAAVDFGHEFRAQDSLHRRKLKWVVFCGDKMIDFNTVDHSKLDLALIELEPATAASRPSTVLPLNLMTDWSVPGVSVVTIGYPGSPPTMLYPPTLLKQLFHSTYGYK
jgi:hypothetical protein